MKKNQGNHIARKQNKTKKGNQEGRRGKKDE